LVGKWKGRERSSREGRVEESSFDGGEGGETMEDCFVASKYTQREKAGWWWSEAHELASPFYL